MHQILGVGEGGGRGSSRHGCLTRGHTYLRDEIDSTINCIVLLRLEYFDLRACLWFVIKTVTVICDSSEIRQNGSKVKK